jgi:effector-binding domain-containing protein
MRLSREWELLSAKKIQAGWVETMTQTILYEATDRIEDVEIRTYPPMKVATVSGYPDNEAFEILFGYISGKNRPSEKIAMTAPVISDAERMSFVMPARYAGRQLPEPLDARIRIEDIPPRKVAVVRFKGHADESSVRDETSHLLVTLEKNGIGTVGGTFLMRYNAPFTPGFLRRNEVGTEVLQ